MSFSVRALVAGAALVSACAAPAPDGAVFVDDLDRAVRVDTPAIRVVSLAPSHTELLFAIGAGDRVVGRTQWDADPPAALAVPSVGDGLDPNVEAIAARRPDLVVAYASAANATAVQQLAQLGIPVFNARVDRLDDVPRAARLFGVLTGHAARASALADSFADRLTAARAAERGAGPRLLLLAWDQPPIVIGGGSFQSEIVTLAGAHNVFNDLTRPSGEVSIETIAARDPDAIVLTGGTTDPAWARRPEWRAVRAVRERRFVFLDGTAFGHPSFRAFTAVDSLRTALRRLER